jgi:hypothetical protein
LEVIYARLITGHRYDEAAQCSVNVGMIQRKGNVPREHLNGIDIVVGDYRQFFVPLK